MNLTNKLLTLNRPLFIAMAMAGLVGLAALGGCNVADGKTSQAASGAAAGGPPVKTLQIGKIQ